MQVFCSRSLACLREQGASEIDTDHIAAPARSRERGIAMTRSHVEHAMVGARRSTAWHRSSLTMTSLDPIRA